MLLIIAVEGKKKVLGETKKEHGADEDSKNIRLTVDTADSLMYPLLHKYIRAFSFLSRPIIGSYQTKISSEKTKISKEKRKKGAAINLVKELPE